MKKVAIDTNVLVTVRLEREYGLKKIKQIFQDCLEGRLALFLTDVVFLETEWVLRSVYKEPKEKVVRFFEELLAIDNLIVKDRKDLEYALSLYKTSNDISFTDTLIIVKYKSLEPDEFFTLDSKLDDFWSSIPMPGFGHKS